MGLIGWVDRCDFSVTDRVGLVGFDDRCAT